MANKDYNFRYTPLTGRLPGNSFVKQTEQAINELAGIVNEGAAQVEVITNLANNANDNSEEALEKANEALETSGRVYITLPNLEDADDYYDSQLYYFANSYSANLPVQDTGFLEVKTNDTKTACEQVFIADDTGLCYFRHGVITSSEVGEETVYSVTWETWSSALASKSYVQEELLNYLPLSGGTLTGDVNGITPPTGDNSKKLATTEYVRIEVGSEHQYIDNSITDLKTNYLPSNYAPIDLVHHTIEYESNALVSNSGDNWTRNDAYSFGKFMWIRLNFAVTAGRNDGLLIIGRIRTASTLSYTNETVIAQDGIRYLVQIDNDDGKMAIRFGTAGQTSTGGRFRYTVVVPMY